VEIDELPQSVNGPEDFEKFKRIVERRS